MNAVTIPRYVGHHSGYGKLHCKNSQPRFSAQQNDATLLRDFFELTQHCSHIVALKIVVANRLV